MDKLAQLLEQEKQLKARIQMERAKLDVQERKIRTDRLISNYHPASFDSRYFGAFPIRKIWGIAHPVWLLN